MNDRSLDIGRALTFMFEEEDWVRKFLIASAMVFFSWLIVPWFLLQGYVVEVIRRVGRNQEPELPRWDDWGQYLSDGLVATVALLFYSLPTVLLACCMALFAIAMSDPQTGELGGGAVLVICCLVFFIILIQIPLYLAYYAGLLRFADRGNLANFFQFGQLWSYIRNNLGQYGFAVLVIIIANVIGGFIPVLGQAWSQLATGHALGQLLDISRGGDVLDTEPPIGSEL